MSAFEGEAEVNGELPQGPLLTDAVEKGFCRVAPVVRGMKGFLALPIGHNGDSQSAPNGNQILSAHDIISRRSEFFDSIDPLLPSALRRSTQQPRKGGAFHGLPGLSRLQSPC